MLLMGEMWASNLVEGAAAASLFMATRFHYRNSYGTAAWLCKSHFPLLSMHVTSEEGCQL